MIRRVGSLKLFVVAGVILAVSISFLWGALGHYWGSDASVSSPRARVLFDFTKAEDAGNADWRIDGAYSTFASALRSSGFKVDSYGSGGGRLNASVLSNYDVLVLPEPQNPFSESEKSAILNFLSEGGGLIYIADHRGSDRNHNGYDSYRIWNENLNFDEITGIHLLSKKCCTSTHRVDRIEHVDILTDNVTSIGMWAGTTMSVSGNAMGVAYQSIGGHNYAVVACSTYRSGRVVVFGDSSSFDDGTPDRDNHGDSLHRNWWRYDNGVFAINMVKWASMGNSQGTHEPPNPPQNLEARAGNGYVELHWAAPNSSISGSSWEYSGESPFEGGYGECVAGDGKYIYILREYDSNSHPLFYRYDPSTNTWTDLSSSVGGIHFENGVAMTYDYKGNFYVLTGGTYRSGADRVGFYRYNISQNKWIRLADSPHVQGAGDAIVYSGYDHMIYAFLGRAHYLGSYKPRNYSVFARYDISKNSWEILPSPPWPGTDDGASLAWTGGKYIYALQGEFYENRPLRNFARFDIENGRWESLPPIPSRDGVGDGGSLLWIGKYDSRYSDVIFALDGNGCNETPGYNFTLYDIKSRSWKELPSIPAPVGYFVGNRLAFASARIWYWQGTPAYWEGGGRKLYSYSLSGSNFGQVSEYRIYRGQKSGEERLIARISGKILEYVDHNVTNGQTYYYYVTALNSYGESGKSNEVKATPQNYSGLLSNKILFVDDDGGSMVSDYIKKALVDSGIAKSFEVCVWDVYQIGYTPDLNTLMKYGIVIWSTGYEYENTLTGEDQENLERYLNNGGRLYLSSQDLLWELSGGYDGKINNEFVNDYLGVESVKNDVGYTKVYGVSGNGISGTLGTVKFDYPYHNYADEITLSSGAVGIFTDYNGAYTASSYEHGNYKVVFTAFSFEAVEKSNSVKGANMMRAIISWLGS